MTKEEIKDFCEMKAQLEPENEDIYNAITKVLEDKIRTHVLKILPQYLEDCVSNGKRFEIRKNDRDYQIGDKLILKEWVDGAFTGTYIERWIIYIHHGTGEFGLAKGYCVLGITDDPNDRYNPT